MSYPCSLKRCTKVNKAYLACAFVLVYLLIMAVVFIQATSSEDFIPQVGQYFALSPDFTLKGQDFTSSAIAGKIEERENYLWETVLFPAGELEKEHLPILEDFDHSRLVQKYKDRTPTRIRKYLNEYSRNGNTLHHRDYRYYKPLSEAGIQANIPLLFGAFAKVCAEKDILFWISHGALIGWAWNNKVLPWDDDIDIQTNVVGFMKLVELNQTVFEERYYLDVNPFALHSRESSSPGDLNRIDARFIDKNNGMFLDITLLVLKFRDTRFCGANKIGTNDTSCKWRIGCKGHNYNFEDLFPLQRTHIDGTITWRPANVVKVLSTEYGMKALTQKRYRGYVWSDAEGIWKKA